LTILFLGTQALWLLSGFHALMTTTVARDVGGLNGYAGVCDRLKVFILQLS
jgi:hypothetical protein